MSMRRARSMQDLNAAGMTYRPPSAAPSDDPDTGGTTVIHVRHGDDDDDVHSPPLSTLSTTSTTQRATVRHSRPPSVRTLRIPPSSGSGRRSRSASRGPPDDGYVIRSLKSTGGREPATAAAASSTHLSGCLPDSLRVDLRD